MPEVWPASCLPRVRDCRVQLSCQTGNHQCHRCQTAVAAVLLRRQLLLLVPAAAVREFIACRSREVRMACSAGLDRCVVLHTQEWQRRHDAGFSQVVIPCNHRR